MPHLIFVQSNSFDPYFNLSVEKYLFDNAKEDEVVFFLWQNERTVVIGRNQNVYAECNLAMLNQLNGKVARRLSGGGAVFHDLGNLNFTFIAKDDCYNIQKQLNVIVKALDQFGLPATISGRNDITITGHKFSGNAFRKVGDTNCHHGTIMINVDGLLLESVLSVDPEKLESKGVSSVASRVANLHDLSSDITVDSMIVALKDACAHEYGKDEFDGNLTVGGKAMMLGTGSSVWGASGSMLKMLQALSDDQKFFSSEEWIYGKNPKFTWNTKKRFDWGSIEICLNFEKNKVSLAKVYSDSLYPNFISALEENLVGSTFDVETIEKAINLAAQESAEDVSLCCREIKKLIHDTINK